jgi:hypothetical protein
MLISVQITCEVYAPILLYTLLSAGRDRMVEKMMPKQFEKHLMVEIIMLYKVFTT